MAKKPNIVTVTTGYQATDTINDNFQNIRNAFDNTLSRDGSLPNFMDADLDMDSNDILNVNTLSVNGLYIDGLPVTPSAIQYNGVTKETQVATSGQTVFNLSNITYTPGINNLSVYVDGVYQKPANYTETDADTVTFSVGLHVGAIVDFVVFTINALPGTTDAVNVTYTPQGVGAVSTTVSNKLKEIVSVKDFGAVGDGVTDDTAAIQAALNAAANIYFPPGTYMTDGGHNIQGKSLIGFNRDASIIKARGTNSGVTIFTGAQSNPSSPGTWGSGGVFRLENLGIYGNWNGTANLTLIGSYNTGVLAANYNATLNTALVKGVSTVYTFIKNCQFAFAYEHAVMFYGNGYSEIDGNIFTTCRGSAIWFAGDKTSPATEASSTSTSTTIEDNQITTCRGGNGALILFLTYGCTVRGNLLEANVYGYVAAEGADCSFFGNYSEMGYNVGDNVGIAPVLITPDIWGYSFIGEAYNPPGNYLPATPRSAVSIDRSGIRIAGTVGYNGAGIQFPAVQAPSTNVNTLDDYKEGTWTPTGNGITFSAASGRYTKIGNVVTIACTVTFPGGTLSGNCLIGSLPYTAGFIAGGAIARSGSLSPLNFVVKLNSGNSYVEVIQADDTGFVTNNTFSGNTLEFSLTYFV